jgi:hypothetical protein
MLRAAVYEPASCVVIELLQQFKKNEQQHRDDPSSIDLSSCSAEVSRNGRPCVLPGARVPPYATSAIHPADLPGQNFRAI